MIPPIEILGLCAAFFTAFSSLPQSIKMIRTKHTRDVSGVTFSMMFISHLLWLSYGIFQMAISIIASNVVAITMVSLVLILKYIVWKDEELS
ncbi:MAG: hypothetical protein CBB87_07670 [Micavibrio sp. TMED27]|nr:hypothetical protein [Micavibrio sp.]OUT90549.1 MAG: hypothetical protein CBB87_07670 [Micavibrio sp. TMED27]|tara:strand:- start:472 stop:747 length:276 start_codon:yes stop_codon:yes gene_type:complete